MWQVPKGVPQMQNYRRCISWTMMLEPFLCITTSSTDLFVKLLLVKVFDSVHTLKLVPGISFCFVVTGLSFAASLRFGLVEIFGQVYKVQKHYCAKSS